MQGDARLYQILADGVLVLHAGLVLFVVAGLFLILLGGARHWQWVRHLWFRLLHLAAIVIVMLESWLDIVCPLTSFELWLRIRAGQGAYQGDFIAHWLGRLLFYQAPPWVFILVYSAFALLVVVSWVIVRPRKMTSLPAYSSDRR
jgi:hypothetical protein